MKIKNLFYGYILSVTVLLILTLSNVNAQQWQTLYTPNNQSGDVSPLTYLQGYGWLSDENKGRILERGQPSRIQFMMKQNGQTYSWKFRNGYGQRIMMKLTTWAADYTNDYNEQQRYQGKKYEARGNCIVVIEANGESNFCSCQWNSSRGVGQFGLSGLTLGTSEPVNSCRDVENSGQNLNDTGRTNQPQEQVPYVLGTSVPSSDNSVEKNTRQTEADRRPTRRKRHTGRVVASSAETKIPRKKKPRKRN